MSASANPFAPPGEANETTGYRPLGILTGLVVSAFALEGVLLVGNNAASLALVARDPGVLTGGEPRDELSTLLGVLVFLGFVLYLLAYVGGGVSFLIWLSRANRNARALGAEGMEFTPGWAVGWFFVPLFNLFKPYEAVDEVYLASDPTSGPDDWGASEAPRFILLWWLAWIGFGAMGGLTSVIGGPGTLTVLTVLTTAAGCAASALAIPVVLAIHRRQREKLARGALVAAAAPQGLRHRFL